MSRMISVLVLAALTTIGVSAAGPESKYRAPRTGDGHADLQGVWNFASGVPLQRPAKFKDQKTLTKEEFDAQSAAMRNILMSITKFAPVENVGLDWIDNKLYVEDLRTSLITYPENGRLPALMDGVQRMPTLEDIFTALSDASNGPPLAPGSLLASIAGGPKTSHRDFTAAERCLDSLAVPILPGFGDNYVQIIQSNNSAAFITDFGRRIVAIDDKPAGSSQNRVRTSMGTSRGHWEGETLVIDTRNFSEQTPGFAGAGRSRDKVVTERITRTSAGTIAYAATIADPSTFKERIELWFPMARVDARIFEATCHEGNYSLANILSAARREDDAQQRRKD